ncbi:MAG: hypothetical protein MN733_15940 [Nitrososphaera sp.]|nr:hypothetical protein [Nitrososphaera sp.]
MSGKKRDDSYFAASRRRNRKYMMIIIPIIAAIAVASVAAAVLAPKGFGALGSAHEHAVFEVRLDGNVIDFSQSQYQVQSQFIHVENRDGTTLHRHSTDVPVGEFFRSVGMDIRDECFIHDNGDQYCEAGDKQLRYFVNGTESSSIMDYILRENDRILINYGNDTQEELQAVFDRLNATPLLK